MCGGKGRLLLQLITALLSLSTINANRSAHMCVAKLGSEGGQIDSLMSNTGIQETSRSISMVMTIDAAGSTPFAAAAWAIAAASPRLNVGSSMMIVPL